MAVDPAGFGWRFRSLVHVAGKLNTLYTSVLAILSKLLLAGPY